MDTRWHQKIFQCDFRNFQGESRGIRNGNRPYRMDESESDKERIQPTNKWLILHGRGNLVMSGGNTKRHLVISFYQMVN